MLTCKTFRQDRTSFDVFSQSDIRADVDTGSRSFNEIYKTPHEKVNFGDHRRELIKSCLMQTRCKSRRVERWNIKQQSKRL